MAYCAVEARLISAVYFERGTILFLPIRSQEDYFFIISVQNHAKGEKKRVPIIHALIVECQQEEGVYYISSN